jgi:hypothetical protein
MTDMPIPWNLSPWLVNAEGQVTRHVYKYTDSGLIEGDPVYLFYFECTKTGALRVFGNEVA